MTFFINNLTNQRSSYNDNTVTDDFEICQKFFLKQYLPLVFPFKISKLSFSLDSRRLFSRFSWSRNIFFNLGNYQLGFGKHGADRARERLTASHENVNKSLTHQVANIANTHRKSQKREAKKCYTTSWNSNRQSPCEINCHLFKKISFVIKTKW